MIFKLLGLLLVIIGAVINFGYKKILTTLLKIPEATTAQEIKVKMLGVLVAIVGAIAVFIAN